VVVSPFISASAAWQALLATVSRDATMTLDPDYRKVFPARTF